MSQSRELILARCRAGLGWVPEAKAPRPLPPPSLPSDPWELAGRFAAEAAKVEAEAWVERDLAAALERLGGLLGGESVLAWDEDQLPAAAWSLAKRKARRLQTGAGFTRDSVTLGLTACDFAVAETGSIGLNAGPGKTREASLIARTHVALVDPSRILPGLPEAFQRIRGLVPSAAHLNLITGPSRTADIEMTLTRGVHGPKHLVLLVAPWERE
jgi:L-lactate dehydrogenase complex protein LldG